jgi:hypothetical protein
MRYQIAGQGESIAIGKTQFYRDPGGWTVRERVEPFVFPNFDSVSQASEVRLGRMVDLNGTEAQIVETTMVAHGETIHYAYWIATRDGLLRQSAMVAPGHYMMEYFSDYDSPIRIDAPGAANVAFRMKGTLP